MAESNGNGGSLTTSGEQHVRDGAIDFTQYSTAQLIELQHNIDSKKFPTNFENLARELTRRERGGTTAPDREIRIRFTDSRGFRGWMHAILNRIPLYGEGFVELLGDKIAIHGLKRTWLGIPIAGDVLVRAENVRNVSQTGDQIEFVVVRRWRSPVLWQFRVEPPEGAERLKALLPTTRDDASRQAQEFNRKVRELNCHPWVTPLLALSNIAVFVGLGVSAHSLGSFDLVQLTDWGANYGELTLSGQWWRLFTCLFVHFNLIHLALNMWVLWSVGRLAERFFGSFAFFTIYMTAGVLASLASLIWNPVQISVGASGAIFGIVGAFLAFLVRRRSGVPAFIFRSHWLPTVLFVLFNIVSGWVQVGVDNAAHVGGLAGGFGIGFALAPPIDRLVSLRSSLIQAIRASAFAGASGLLVAWYLHGYTPTIPERFEQTHGWLTVRANENLRDWQNLANQASTGTISNEVLAERFEHDILPFWRETHNQLQREISENNEESAYTRLMDDWIASRLGWAKAVIDVARSGGERRAQDALGFEQQGNLARARVDRVALLAGIAQGLRPLRDRSLFLGIKDFVSAHTAKCVEEPIQYGPRVGPADAISDGPAGQHTAGCLAQKLFVTGNYADLDRLLARSVRSLADLRDGSSTLSGEMTGLDDLFQFGNIDLAEALGRTSDWRKTIPGSIAPDLIDVMIFDNWAYAARGTDYASKVSPQAMMIFGYRSEMAAAGLREMETRASSNPVWYQLSLSIGRNQGMPLAQLRSIFDRGRSKFPQYLPLYTRMLNILMPRWYGSYEMVDQFIVNTSESYGTSPELHREMYSRLYTIYAGLEGNDFDVVQSARADKSLMKAGLMAMWNHHPKSDFVLNLYAKFLCSVGDAAAYQSIRPLLTKHESATAWSASLYINTCDTILSHFQPPGN